MKGPLAGWHPKKAERRGIAFPLPYALFRIMRMMRAFDKKKGKPLSTSGLTIMD
jgi:hypothetical protein